MSAPRTDGAHVLVIEDLHAQVAGHEVLKGIDLQVRSGEVHVVMGPNGSGKSTLAHTLMGRPGTTVTSGTVTIDGTDLLALAPWQRARAGLFLALQQPIEVPGVRLEAMLAEAMAPLGSRDGADDERRERMEDRPDLRRDGPVIEDDSRGAEGALRVRMLAEAAAIGFDRRFLDRPVNVDLSGGERKRNEMVQLGVLHPPFCILDEIDSGLDVDALHAVASRLEAATRDWGLGVLAVTHFQRLLVELRADRVHVLVDGRIAASGGPELAHELERTGYGAYGVG